MKNGITRVGSFLWWGARRRGGPPGSPRTLSWTCERLLWGT